MFKTRKNLVSISSLGDKNSKMNKKIMLFEFDCIKIDNPLQQLQQFPHIEHYQRVILRYY